MNSRLAKIAEKRQINSANRKEHRRTRLINLACYFILVGIGFVYLYPILYMLVMSIMPTTDLINPTIQWIPTSIDFEGYSLVYQILDYGKSLGITVYFAVICSIFQTITCAFAGYALARYSVPLSKFWVVMLLLIFVLPTDVVSVPRYVLYNEYGLIGKLSSMIIPALLGQGLKASMFILMFMQSFKSYPKSYDEAAQLDGAGNFRLFFKVALPLAIPMVILCLLFSFIWYWNETTQSELFFNGVYKTLPLQLKSFDSTYSKMVSSSFGSAENRLNERIQMAATMLVIAPLMLLYFIVQKSMIGSIESAGITGE